MLIIYVCILFKIDTEKLILCKRDAIISLFFFIFYKKSSSVKIFKVDCKQETLILE